MRVRLFSDDESLNVHVHGLFGLKHMTTYQRVKPATAGPVADTFLGLKMLCLFYFALESEKMAIMSGLRQFYFPPFYSCFFFYFNPQCQLILGSIHDPAVH